MKLSTKFKARIQARYQGYDLKVGVLEDKPHAVPRVPRALGSMQGGPVRKRGIKTQGTNGTVARRMQKRYKFLTLPWRKRSSKDLRRFIKAFFELAGQKTRSYTYVETAMRAVVRNPILRGAYGRNRKVTREAKGFDRLMIDTGQMFRAIKARIRRIKVVPK